MKVLQRVREFSVLDLVDVLRSGCFMETASSMRLH